MCDAANDEAVQTLRQRKHRPHKPLAVMFPLAGEDGLDGVREHLEVDEVTAAALTDPARPIVLARSRSDVSRDPIPKQGHRGFRRSTAVLSPHLAPGLKELGAFLPYSPLAP